MTTYHTNNIAVLNDLFRTTWLTGKVFMTEGILSLAAQTRSRIAEAVQTFNAFTSDNDPHGEHDFGAVSVDGYKVFWKIDYYDKAMECGSDNPADPKLTTRVLTIMLAEEY